MGGVAVTYRTEARECYADHMEIEYGKCHCGCGELTVVADRTDRKQSKVRGEPQRYVLGHNRRRTPEPYRVDPETGCWIWLRYVTPAGYGRVARGPGKAGLISAHRWYYEQRHGKIPPGLHLDHLCRRPACVNPDHLEPVTPRENVLRSSSTRMTDEQIRVARFAVQNGAGVRATARAMGTTHATLIRRFKSLRPKE